jgi:hypothetical protein
MRRVTLMVAAMALMVSLFAVVAYAATIRGTNDSETLIESPGNDQISGRGGDDDINAGFYDIGQTPGGLGDTDEVKGNRGRDFIDLVDGDNRDTADGGRGIDECVGDPGDDLTNCEL